MFTFFDAIAPTAAATAAPNTIQKHDAFRGGERVLSACSTESPNSSRSSATDSRTIRAATKTGPATASTRIEDDAVRVGPLSSVVADVLLLLPMSAVTMPEIPPSVAM